MKEICTKTNDSRNFHWVHTKGCFEVLKLNASLNEMSTKYILWIDNCLRDA